MPSGPRKNGKGNGSGNGRTNAPECAVCGVEKGRYKCPAFADCGVMYCSVKCYGEHKQVHNQNEGQGGETEGRPSSVSDAANALPESHDITVSTALPELFRRFPNLKAQLRDIYLTSVPTSSSAPSGTNPAEHAELLAHGRLKDYERWSEGNGMREFAALVKEHERRQTAPVE